MDRLLILGIVLLIVGACIVLVPALARLEALGWICVIVGIVLIAVSLLQSSGAGSDAFFVPLLGVRWVARALRAAANRLDPEPPHMQEALRLLGWAWDPGVGTYTSAPSGTANASVNWYYGPVGGDGA
jgi:sulfite exporter TauE/SafE